MLSSTHRLFCGRTGVDIGESPVSFIVQPAGGRYFSSTRIRVMLAAPRPCTARSKSSLQSSVFPGRSEDDLFVRVFYIAQRCIGSIVCAIGKSCVHGSLDLFAGLSGVHFIQDV